MTVDENMHVRRPFSDEASEASRYFKGIFEAPIQRWLHGARKAFLHIYICTLQSFTKDIGGRASCSS